jgi:Kef-type K+ transport system membrane component KefB
MVMILIAVVVPIIISLFRLPVAEVVLLILAGIVVGPQVLDLVTVDAAITLIGDLGLGFLFFLAGLELDQRVLRGRVGKLSATAWTTTLVLAVAVAYGLMAMGAVDDAVGFAIVLTSTALGTLLPVLRDSGDLDTPFGRMFMGAGAWGEFGPVVALSVFLSTRNAFTAVLSLAAFGIIALLLSRIPRLLTNKWMREYLLGSIRTSSQTAVRVTLLLLITLLALAEGFGLDIVMGAFIGGVILRRYLPQAEEGVLQGKLEGLAFGLFIPIFFILSGVGLDIASILSNPFPMLIVFVLFLVVRGLPTFVLYRKDVPNVRERTRLTLYVSTALPIIVAVTSIQVSSGLMSSNDAAELVAAGVLSVMVFPLIAGFLKPRDKDRQDRSSATA